jgi:hypothetical protein
MDQILATCRSMCDYKTWTHFLGAAMFIPRRLANNRSLSDAEDPHAPCDDHLPRPA